MKRKVLKKWVQIVITTIVIINSMVLIGIQDFKLSALPLLLLMMLITIVGLGLLAEYGRGK